MNTRNFFFTAFLMLAALAHPPAHAEEILAQGEWTNISYDIRGHWQIIADDDARVIRFDENFSTRKGPDLHVYLSPDLLAQVKERSVAARSFEIAELISHRGAQEYEIPAELNLDDFRSLLIHCKTYAHLWGGADLAR